MSERARSRLKLERQLRQAVEQKQFSLLYQPQFYLESGKLRGFEALLRWSEGNPERIAPVQFIPMLEEMHLINPLGEWIFTEGLTHLLKLQEAFGSGFVLSLNVSPVQFAQPKLVEHLTEFSRQYAILVDQLDIKATQKQLAQLRELGVKIAVDDFGTGYSSLAYLRQFDIDTLKIDRLFITNMLDSPRDAAVVKTIIDLARHLGLEVIAEGVETEAQRQWLLANHCAIMQGWLVAPALPLPKALEVPRRLDWEQVPLNKS